MGKIIEEKDMKEIEKIAKRYDMSAIELSREIIRQNKKRNDIQFRVSDEEFEIISKKAKEYDMSISRYCEYACKEFISEERFDEYWENRIYKCKRTKRIAMFFKNDFYEREMLKMSEVMSVTIGALIRYCALHC